MRKINSILLSGIVLFCNIAEARTKIQNDLSILREIEINRPWGKLNYTTFSHFDIVFDQFDLKRAKACSIEGGLRIPMGVTHVYLELSGSYNFIEFPETVKYVKKDIFKKCKVKTILLSHKLIESLLKKNYGENNEENLRKYFYLNDDTEIVIGRIITIQNNTENNIPETPLCIKDKEQKNNFLDEIHMFNKENLKHIEDDNAKKNSDENKFTNEIHNFDKNKLKHVKKDKKVDQTPANPLFDEIHNFDKNKLKHHKESKKLKQSDSMLDSLREAIEKRRASIEPDTYEEEESDWDD